MLCSCAAARLAAAAAATHISAACSNHCNGPGIHDFSDAPRRMFLRAAHCTFLPGPPDVCRETAAASPSAPSVAFPSSRPVRWRKMGGDGGEWEGGTPVQADSGQQRSVQVAHRHRQHRAAVDNAGAPSAKHWRMFAMAGRQMDGPGRTCRSFFKYAFFSASVSGGGGGGEK